MAENWGVHKGIEAVTRRAASEWSGALRKLLEEKHLYQNVSVSIPEIKTDIFAKIASAQASIYDSALKEWEARRLAPVTKLQHESMTVSGSLIPATSPILLLTNVKLFCSVCGSPEVYSPLWGRDAAGESKDHRGNDMPRSNNSQLFFLAYQCQRCESDPEGFIVRRAAYKLFLEGRSPLEYVDLPRYLPKPELRFFSDAVVAFNAGKKLAGLFYLRVFLEQFARRLTNLSGRKSGEELMDAYTETLPLQHRDHMPSFREWYEKLSGALHTASEDDQLFETAKTEIERHFDIRRVFRIPEKTVSGE